MATTDPTIFVGNDNKLTAQIFTRFGVARDLIAIGVTRALLQLAGKTIDSQIYPAAVDFTTGGADGLITFDLTGFEFPVGSFGARIVIFYPGASNGEVVADGLPVKISEGLTGTNPDPVPPVDLLVPYTGATKDLEMGAFDLGVNSVRLETTPVSPGSAQGTFYWNDTDKTYNFAMATGTGVVGQLFEELFAPLVHNSTGTQLDNGTAVYVNGVLAGEPTVAKANSNNIATSQVVGLLTHDLTDGADGYVTAWGLVRDYDTSGLSVGKAYLSAVTDGELVSIPPSSPHNPVLVGTVLVSSATVGVIFVHPGVPLAADVALGTSNSIAPTQKAVNDAIALLPSPAYASKAEQVAGTATEKSVTPSTQQYHNSASKAWVVYDNNGTPVVNASYNVSSVDDDGVGLFTVHFTVSFDNIHYMLAGGGEDHNNTTGDLLVNRPNGGVKTTSACQIAMCNSFDTPVDTDDVGVVFFGLQ